MAIFIKLLATKIVASNFFGRSKRDATIRIALEPLSIPSLILVFVNENNATSAPEINAEKTNSTTNTIILVKNDALKLNAKNSTKGSGSKIKIY